ncbi:MAG TPA: anhydro-N-acetylmuramic acid kinase [Bacteroidota bacterium]|nr:anhydro-N-acetylmuramic acid kinase [Bacteroidota bacterium]
MYQQVQNSVKAAKLAVGLMSGTSLDGIDAVLIRIRGTGGATRYSQLAHVFRPFPAGLKQRLLENSVPATSRVDEITRLNVLLAHLSADAVVAVARKASVALSRVAFIGSHGQTLQHLPEPVRMFGTTIRATLQIGDPSVIATLTDIPTVGNFRLADMAVGGQGAPLVPYVDWLLFTSTTKNRMLLNIGGIANITVLPRRCGADDVVAFDTGPGNMVIDALMQKLYHRPFDRNGAVAMHGLVSHELFRWLARHPFLRRKPPRSTGREEFGGEFVDRFLARARQYDREDIVTTATLFTAYCVHDAYMWFVARRTRVDEVFVSGGGARNVYLMHALQDYFWPVPVQTLDATGIRAEAKEALCFAILANETMAGRPANLPSVTGARKSVVLGTVAWPQKP